VNGVKGGNWYSLWDKVCAESYGFRPGRGAKGVLREIAAALEAGHHWLVDADLKGYFDSIPHDALMEEVQT
jgi:RNA-directed DNA polymerase